MNTRYAESPLTANIGVVSNYIWHVTSQSADEAAVPGGIEYAQPSGFYAGARLSSLVFSTNTDIFTVLLTGLTT